MKMFFVDSFDLKMGVNQIKGQMNILQGVTHFQRTAQRKLKKSNQKAKFDLIATMREKHV